MLIYDIFSINVLATSFVTHEIVFLLAFQLIINTKKLDYGYFFEEFVLGFIYLFI